VLYVVFWILLAFLFFPSEKAIKAIPIWVFLITCALEILQLWHPPILEKVRSRFLGRTLIGTSFAWWDFPHYAIGSIIGWVWIKGIIWRGD
jgi:hypothetical protein